MSDNHGHLCFALALWNEQDAILKERLFGLTGNEGNHGEDVKEYYYYLDSTPTHSYMRALYRYPQRAFPYGELVDENRRRSKDQPEYELVDTGVFAEDRYFDVQIEYAKASPTDIIVRITATNRGPDRAPLHILPTLWFRNTWSWNAVADRPLLRQVAPSSMTASHPRLGTYTLSCAGTPDLLFTENESNTERLWGDTNQSPYVKDGINNAVVYGRTDLVNPERTGTKAAAHYVLHLSPGEWQTVHLRLSAESHAEPLASAEHVLALREAEADAFYTSHFGAPRMTEDERRMQRQAFAGLLWSTRTRIPRPFGTSSSAGMGSSARCTESFWPG